MNVKVNTNLATVNKFCEKFELRYGFNVFGNNTKFKLILNYLLIITIRM